MRAAVVDLDPELSDAETPTVISLIPSVAPSLLLFDVKDAPMHVTRREYEVFRKRRKTYAEAQTSDTDIEAREGGVVVVD